MESGILKNASPFVFLWKTGKDWKADGDSDARMLDVGDEVPLEQMGEEMTSFSGHPF